MPEGGIAPRGGEISPFGLTPAQFHPPQGSQVGVLQTASLFLPLALRRLKIALPPRVAMRARNPCVRFRFMLLGWYVLFIDFSFYENGFRGPKLKVF